MTVNNLCCPCFTFFCPQIYRRDDSTREPLKWNFYLVCKGSMQLRFTTIQQVNQEIGYSTLLKRVLLLHLKRSKLLYIRLLFNNQKLNTPNKQRSTSIASSVLLSLFQKVIHACCILPQHKKPSKCKLTWTLRISTTMKNTKINTWELQI